MLTVANGLTSVPSPLKSIPSTMAFGCATPPTMFHPCVANRYEPDRVYTPQGGTRGCARATPGVLNAIAATKLTNAQAKSKELVKLLTNFIFISLISFYCFGLPWLPTVGGHFWPFTEVVRKIRREVTRKVRFAGLNRGNNRFYPCNQRLICVAIRIAKFSAIFP